MIDDTMHTVLVTRDEAYIVHELLVDLYISKVKELNRLDDKIDANPAEAKIPFGMFYDREKLTKYIDMLGVLKLKFGMLL